MDAMGATWHVVPRSFTDDGNLDLNGQERLVEAAIEEVKGLSVLGIISEASSLSKDKRLPVLDAVLPTVDHRVPVVAGRTAANVSTEYRRHPACRDPGRRVRDDLCATRISQRGSAAEGSLGAADCESLETVAHHEPPAIGILTLDTVMLKGAQAARAGTIKLGDLPTTPKISAPLALDDGFHSFGGLSGVSASVEPRWRTDGTTTKSTLPDIVLAVRRSIENDDREEAGRILDAFLPLIRFGAQPLAGLTTCKEVLRRPDVIVPNATPGLTHPIDETTARELPEILSRVGRSPDSLPFEMRV